MIGAAIQAALGVAQGVAGFIQQHKATKQLEGMQSPTYNPNKSITDFYNESLKKYNVNPYNTDLYRMQQQNANRGLASGLTALSGRGQALAGVNNLVQGRNDALLKAGAAAEERQGQDLNRLGNAAAMKTTEDQRAFQINQQDPFERKYNLLAQKAGGGTQIANAGISNLGQAAMSFDQSNMLNKMYKSNNSSSNYNYGDTVNPSNVLRDLYRNQNRRVGTSRNVQIGG